MQIYAVKGALQHLLNMVDKPAQLLDNAVMKGLNFFVIFVRAARSLQFFSKNHLHCPSTFWNPNHFVFHMTVKKTQCMAIGKILDVTTNNFFWERQRCPEQHHIVSSWLC